MVPYVFNAKWMIRNENKKAVDSIKRAFGGLLFLFVYVFLL